MLRVILALAIACGASAALGQEAKQENKPDTKQETEEPSKMKLPAVSAFATRLFAGKLSTDKKSYACFVRVYDGAHLAAHPLQKVRSMKVLVTAELDEQPYAPTDANKLGYSFRMGVNFTKRSGDFDSSSSCGFPSVEEGTNKVAFNCGVDCDGGGISIEMREVKGEPKSDKAILVRLERIRIWRNNRPEDEGLDLSGGADDRVFRLDRVSVAMCKSLITDRKELAAIRTLKK